LYCEGVLLDGVKTGPYRQYYANGRMALSQNFLDLSENVFHQEEFYINGNLHHRGYFHSGNKVNEWQYFDRNGLLSKTEYYNKYGRLKRIKDTESGQPSK
jgi:antitoxin component YwqK of YwqJK toxin-antitoxin module